MIQNNQEEENSLLKKALESAENQEKEVVKPFKLVSGILGGLRNREQDVLVARYGLSNDKATKETLESIGKKFEVTRERVRQIENAALKKIRKNYMPKLKVFWKRAGEHFDKHGGVAEFDELINHLGIAKETAEAELDRRALRLLMSVHDQIDALKKQPIFREGWMEKHVDLQELRSIHSTAQAVLKEAGQPMPEADLVSAVSSKLNLVSDKQPLIMGAVKVDPKISLDQKGNWGLTEWPLVAPKRIRDKVYLVLEEKTKPLHFDEITKLIAEKYPSSKPVLSRTVHNELIGDKRFVLVGRGIYALKSWGYKPGVVADVVKEILEDAKEALHIDEIVDGVMKRRQVKKNTIVANLQNRDLFRKVAKSTYTLNKNEPAPSDDNV